MSNIISTVISILIILISISFWHPKIRKRLNLKRIRNSYGLFCLFFGLVVLDLTLLYGITIRDIITFAVGAIVGIPFGIYVVRDAFKKVKDNTLYFERDGKKRTAWIYIFSLLAIGFAIGMGLIYTEVSEATVKLFLKITWIFSFTSAVASFLEIVRYEKKHGPIYVEFRKHNT